MRQAAPLLAVLLLASACATGPGADDCAANAFCSARRAEPRALADARGLAGRKGDVLFLHPKAAPELSFPDHRAACEAHDVDACERYALQFLDDTVSFARLGLARNGEGGLRIARTYKFEFSDTGNNRREGAILLLGAEVEDLHLEPYPVQ